jgi:O-antigen/teichoic acid export membrane protein
MTRTTSLARNSFWVFAAKWLGLMAATAASVVIARCLGADGKGRLALLSSVVTLFRPVALLGLPTAAVYYIAKHRWPPLWVLTRGYLASCLVCLCGVLTLWAGGDWLAAKIGLPAGDLPLLWLMVMLMPIELAAEHIGQVLRARDDLAPQAYFILLRTSGALALVLVLVAALGMGLFGAVISDAGAYTLCTAMLAWIAVRTVNWRAGEASRCRVMSFLGYGLAYSLFDLLAGLVRRVDLLIVGHFCGPSAAGQYSVSMVGAEFVPSVSAALGYALLSRAAGQSSDAALSTTALAYKVAVHSGLATAAVLLPLGVLVPVIWGPAFAPAVVPFWIVLAGMVFVCGSVIIQSSLTASGHIRLLLVGCFASLVTEVVADLALVPSYGIRGAALGYASAAIVESLVYLAVFRQVTRVWLVSRVRITSADRVVLIAAIRRLLGRT